jgi:hypothetical protein
MSKTRQAADLIMAIDRHVISLRDDLKPLFAQSANRELRRYMTFAIWGLKNRGLLLPLSHGAYVK